jgi:exopolyphosphatase/guanosine-5'-triphosphate,3'-diphosphate pyrophosphatase
VAAVDEGTNSTRLLVAEPEEGGGFEELARDMIITRLGQGVDATGRLASDALERTLEVIARYVRRARALHVERIRVGATAAVRDASNADSFERPVRELAGTAPEIVSGDEESRLSFLGATRGLDAPASFLVLDIGGGSTEFVLGTERPTSAISTQMGSVRLTERFVRRDPPPAADVDRMRAAVGELLDDVERAIPVADARTFVAVAGTSTTVQAIALGLGFYDPERIHRTRLSRADAARVSSRLAGMTTGERAALPVMAPGRADVIVAGSVILVAIMERFGFGEAIVSETDILEGLVLEMLELA